MKTALRGRLSPKAGFTLIELLVVVAIIALLLSILLPSLAGAKEQANKAKCLANTRQLQLGRELYSEDNTSFCFAPGTDPAWNANITNVNWVGYAAPEPDSFANGILGTFGADRRPLNSYIIPDLTERDRPKLFECPSDTGGYTIGDDQNAPVDREKTPNYRTLGTSYTFSWNYINGRFTRLAIRKQGRQVWLRYQTGEGSLFIWAYEDPADIAFDGSNYDGTGTAIQRRGWHKKFSQHTMMYLDGHSDNRFIDTRFRRGSTWRVR